MHLELIATRERLKTLSVPSLWPAATRCCSGRPQDGGLQARQKQLWFSTCNWITNSMLVKDHTLMLPSSQHVAQWDSLGLKTTSFTTGTRRYVPRGLEPAPRASALVVEVLPEMVVLRRKRWVTTTKKSGFWCRKKDMQMLYTKEVP